MEKVKLPREVAEALEDTQLMDHEMLFCKVVNMQSIKHKTRQMMTLESYFTNHGYLLLAQALLIGYEVEQTPEDKVREYFKQLQRNGNMKLPHIAVIDALDLLDIKIDGVNT